MTAVPALTATATEFNTESNYDYMTIGSTLYSGTAGPTNVYMAAGDTIFWESDGSATRGGWTICAGSGSGSSAQRRVSDPSGRREWPSSLTT